MISTKQFYKITAIFSALALFQCSKVALDEVENLRDNTVVAIGHGGAGYHPTENDLPSNSLGSITKAVEGYGVAGVEVDVQLSADSVLFLYHDSGLESLTNCNACISIQAAADLDRCRYRYAVLNVLLSDEKLCRLSRIMDRFSVRSPKPYIFLDIKTSPGCDQALDNQQYITRMANALLRFYATYQCHAWVLVETNDRDLIQMLREKDPQLPIVLFGLLSDSNLDYAEEMELRGISANHSLVTKDEVIEAHRRGLWVTLEEVIIRQDAVEAIGKSPEFIYTDNIPLLHEILR